MHDFNLNLLINILLMTFGIISIIDLIYDKSSPNSFPKNIKKGGWILLVIALSSILFNYIKDKDEFESQLIITKEKANVDSLLQATQLELKELQLKTKDTILSVVESTYLKSIKTTNEALAIYNLSITDSLNSVINKLKINSVNPQLTLAPSNKNRKTIFIEKIDGEEMLNIQFISVSGTCYNISLKCYILDQRNNNSIVKSGILTFGNQFITTASRRGYLLNISEVNVEAYDELVVFVTGSFSKDSKGKIITPFDVAFRYNFKKNIYISGYQLDFEHLKRKLNTI